MKKLYNLPFAAIASIVSFAPVTARADVVIGDWEAGSLDGWIEWSGFASFSSSTLGATRGSNSIKVVPNASFSQHLALKLQDEELMDEFVANTQLSIDVSWQTSDWTPAAGTQGAWAVVDNLAVNSPRVSTGSWTELGKPIGDTGNPNFPGGWDPTNFGAFHTRTVTWDYSSLLDGNPDNLEIVFDETTGLPFFVEFILVTAFDSNFNLGGAAYYFDNARLSTIVGSGSWTGATDANWSTAGNWGGDIPSGVDGVASFGAITSGRYNVNVDGARTLGGMVFDSATSYTLSGSAITMQATAGNPTISVSQGSHTIASPLTLNNWLFVTVLGGGALDISGAVNVTPSGRSLQKNGAGLLQLAQISTGTVQINAGQVCISAKGSPNSTSGTTVADALVIADGASLDLTNNSLVINYTDPVGSLIGDTRLNLLSGKLTSSAADATRRLGFGDNAILGRTEFAGQTVDASSVLVKFTFAGDANLDGQVDVADLGALASSWQTSGVWTGGDFDYSGFVDVADLGMLASNWQAGVGSPLGPSLSEALASVGLGGASVPEPAACAMFLGVGTSLGLRRRVIFR
jgi:hypothetical protein